MTIMDIGETVFYNVTEANKRQSLTLIPAGILFYCFGGFRKNERSIWMELNQLRYFIEIYHTGSLSKAAEKLHISQQGLSSSLRRLEKELGRELFVRHPNGLVLTEDGVYLKDEAEAVMQHIDKIYGFFRDKELADNSITVAGTINSITRVPYELQQLLLRGNESVKVNYLENWTQDCEQAVYDGEADIGIVYGECDEDRFDVVTLDVLKQVFIVNRNSPLAELDEIEVGDLAGTPMIIPPKRCRPGMKLRKLFADAGVPLNVAYNCDRPRQIIEMVKANPDFAARIIIDDVSDLDRETVKILRLKGDPFLLPICMITKKGRTLSMTEHFFMHLVTDCFIS